MLIDPTGSLYDNFRLEMNLPEAWKAHAWLIYRVRRPNEDAKEIVFLTNFIRLKAYS